MTLDHVTLKACGPLVSILMPYLLFVLFTQVVGSQARILYSDQKGRTEIATAFNEAVGSKKLKVS